MGITGRKNKISRKFNVSKDIQIKLGIKHLFSKKYHVVNGVHLDNYKGYRGYDHRYGEYVGSLAVMLYYLQWQNPVAHSKYHRIVKEANKKGNKRLSSDEIDKLKWEIWGLLHPETQRKLRVQDFLVH